MMFDLVLFVSRVILFVEIVCSVSVDVTRIDDKELAKMAVHEYHECLGRRERRLKDARRQREERERDRDRDAVDRMIDDKMTEEDDIEDEEEIPLTNELRNEGEDLQLNCDVCQPPTESQM